MSLTCFHRNELSLFPLITFSKKTCLAVRMRLIAPEFEIFPVLLLMIKVSIFLSKGYLFSEPCGFVGPLNAFFFNRRVFIKN